MHCIYVHTARRVERAAWPIPFAVPAAAAATFPLRLQKAAERFRSRHADDWHASHTARCAGARKRDPQSRIALRSFSFSTASSAYHPFLSLVYFLFGEFQWFIIEPNRYKTAAGSSKTRVTSPTGFFTTSWLNRSIYMVEGN